MKQNFQYYPIGTEFYHSEYGRVYFSGINTKYIYSIRFTTFNNSGKGGVTGEGICNIHYNGECVFFPSKEQRDWSKFKRFWDNSKVEEPKVTKFNVNTLQPFDKVLVRDEADHKWCNALFAYMNNMNHPVLCVGTVYKTCIPYNEETKHLLGTNEDCPDYYKWWD